MNSKYIRRELNKETTLHVQVSKWSLISNVNKMYVHSNILAILVNTLVKTLVT